MVLPTQEVLVQDLVDLVPALQPDALLADLGLEGPLGLVFEVLFLDGFFPLGAVVPGLHLDIPVDVGLECTLLHLPPLQPKHRMSLTQL